MSGCEIAGDRFIDAHHGRLLDAQLVLLDRLLAICPGLRAVTFEDPRLDDAGGFAPGNAESLARLEAAVAGWRSGPPAPPLVGEWPTPLSPLPANNPERELASLLYDRDARRRWRTGCRSSTVLDTLNPDTAEEIADSVVALVRDSRHRGTGRLPDLFPGCVAAWRRLHPEDEMLLELVARFLASPAARLWREQPGGAPGASVEACFADFAIADGFVDPLVCEEELFGALLRTLTVTPDPAFTLPAEIRRAPGGWFAVSGATPPVLHAAAGGKYIRGEITPFIAALLVGAPLARATATHPLILGEATAVRDRLVAMGLLPS